MNIKTFRCDRKQFLERYICMAELVSNSTIFLNTDSVEEREKSLKKKMLFALKCNKYTHKNLLY